MLRALPGCPAAAQAFAKREKQEIKALTKRLKQYEEGSAPALALNATIEKTKARFAKYANQGLLCGTDGLPHLIADPGLALRYGHAGDVFVSSRRRWGVLGGDGVGWGGVALWARTASGVCECLGLTPVLVPGGKANRSGEGMECAHCCADRPSLIPCLRADPHPGLCVLRWLAGLVRQQVPAGGQGRGQAH